MLLVAKFTSYLLQKFLVANKSFVTCRKIRSLLAAEVFSCKTLSLIVAEVARWKESFTTRSKIWSLSIAEVAHPKKSLATCCRICTFSKITRWSLQNFLVTHRRNSENWFFRKVRRFRKFIYSFKIIFNATQLFPVHTKSGN